ncbi:MAG: hypothetical protein FRX49_10346 [Trebouxia sp. A1-2]|nr:MAG: hypothetical protein FRX49_10346 [Trebouxia sp. A1-2]
MPAVGQSHQGGQSPVTHQQWLLDADLVTNIHKYIAGRPAIYFELASQQIQARKSLSRNNSA